MSPSRTPARAFALAAPLVAALITVVAPSAHAALGTAVEYYHPVLRHYFMTAYPDEAAMLDGGQVVKGWKRTGGEFTIHTDPAPDRLPVCRFYGAPGSGLQTHFYTANPAECEWVKTLPKWKFEAIAFYIQVPAAGACPVATTPVYRSFFSDQILDVNHRFSVDLTVAARQPLKAGWVSEGIVMCSPLSDADLHADAVRLLEQASLGPTEASVLEVKAKGPGLWINEQLGLNVTRYTQLPYWKAPDDNTKCMDDRTPPATPEKYCGTNKWSPAPVVWEFFRQSKTAPDQLRLRMAHAWHQILVLGSDMFGHAYAFANFHQRVRDGVFGTFEQLLTTYALSPQLGHYQSWINNVPEYNGIRPNENFARELMQLFTIGVNALNEDGTPQLDAQGNLIPTYSQADIETLARILTGFTWPPLPNMPTQWGWEPYYVGDMVPIQQFHDTSYKNLLNGRLIYYTGNQAQTEVRGAIKMLVDHPNTPPFICKQLIQKLVTSLPTPGYVYRVVQVFKNNGNGVRGDLAAVTRAILLDPEARGARKIDPLYGRMREPALLWTAMIRGMDIVTDGVQPRNFGWNSGQQLFSPPTVFNYYPADFTLIGTDIPAPEFGIFTSAEFLNRANQINDLLYNVDQPWNAQWWGPQGYAPNAVGTQSPALTAFLPDAGNADALVARIDRLFLHGTMRPEMRKTIVNAVNKLPQQPALRRVKMAINLTLVSIDYQVQK